MFNPLMTYLYCGYMALNLLALFQCAVKTLRIGNNCLPVLLVGGVSNVAYSPLCCSSRCR